MRKKRSQYKVCGRLGYNARLRLWTGKKKKWQKLGRFDNDRSQSGRSESNKQENEPKKVVNQGVRLTNVERRGERNGASEGNKESHGKKTNTRMRRKDVHGRIQSQKTGRKTRYGGVKRKTIRNDIQEQRKLYKGLKSANERRYRKGRRGQSQEKQLKQNHRRARTEVRVDRRRWRSGRVPTLQMGRDLVEHGHVSHVNEDGSVGEVAKWQGARVESGHGRKVSEAVWKKMKGRSRSLLEHEEYAKTAAPYREVDYVTGRRVVLRKPESTEVVMPKGMDVSGWTSF